MHKIEEALKHITLRGPTESRVDLHKNANGSLDSAYSIGVKDGKILLARELLKELNK